MENNVNPPEAVSSSSSQSLLLDIMHAAIFINTEVVGEMDPFVEMQYFYPKKDKELHMPPIRTTTKREAGKKPVWNEKFIIPLYKTFKIGSIVFKIYDKNVKKSDLIGQLKVSIEDLVVNFEKNQNQCIKLRIQNAQNEVTAVLHVRASIQKHHLFKETHIAEGFNQLFRGNNKPQGLQHSNKDEGDILPSSFFLNVENLKDKVQPTLSRDYSSDLEHHRPPQAHIYKKESQEEIKQHQQVLHYEKVKQLLKDGAKHHYQELSKRVQSLTHTKPDFGYPDQIEFKDNAAQQKSRGWGFFLDMISKFRQREKISNTINYYYDAKLKWKEGEIQKILNSKPAAVPVAGHKTHSKAVHFHSIVLKNTPHQNWLLWHYQKGKKQTTQNLAEVKISKIKKEAEQLEHKVNQERSWFDSYKKSYIAKINNKEFATSVTGKSERVIEREKNESVQREIKRHAVKILLGQAGEEGSPEKTRSVTQHYINRRNTNSYRTDYQAENSEQLRVGSAMTGRSSFLIYHNTPRMPVMYVNKSVTRNNSSNSIDQEVKLSARDNYGHKQDTLDLLDYLFSIYKIIDQRQLSKRFNQTSSMLLSESKIKKLVLNLQNSKDLGPETSPTNPLNHFKKLLLIRQLILAILNRQKQSLYFKGYKYDELMSLVKYEEFYERFKYQLDNYAQQNSQYFSFDQEKQSYLHSANVSDSSPEGSPFNFKGLNSLKSSPIDNVKQRQETPMMKIPLGDLRVTNQNSNVSRTISQFRIKYISNPMSKRQIIQQSVSHKIRLTENTSRIATPCDGFGSILNQTKVVGSSYMPRRASQMQNVVSKIEHLQNDSNRAQSVLAYSHRRLSSSDNQRIIKDKELNQTPADIEKRTHMFRATQSSGFGMVNTKNYPRLQQIEQKNQINTNDYQPKQPLIYSKHVPRVNNSKLINAAYINKQFNTNIIPKLQTQNVSPRTDGIQKQKTIDAIELLIKPLNLSNY